jgi:hypothetical protein
MSACVRACVCVCWEAGHFSPPSGPSLAVLYHQPHQDVFAGGRCDRALPRRYEQHSACAGEWSILWLGCVVYAPHTHTHTLSLSLSLSLSALL